MTVLIKHGSQRVCRQIAIFKMFKEGTILMPWKSPSGLPDDRPVTKLFRFLSKALTQLFRAVYRILCKILKPVIMFFVSIVFVQVMFVDQYLRIKGVLPEKVLGIDWDELVSTPIFSSLYGNTHNYLNYFYKSIDQAFGGLGGEILFMLPLALWALFATTNLTLKRWNKAVEFISMSWTFFVLIYGLIYLLLSENKTLEFFFVITPIVWLSSLLVDVSKTGRYSMMFYGRNTISADSIRPDSKNYSNMFMRTLFIVTVAMMFWFNITVPSNYAWQLYILSVSSCLFVIGFLALIFTYAHSSITSERIRIKIQEDIEAVYRTVGVTILASLICMLVFPGRNIDFSLSHGVGVDALALALFLLTSGGIVLCIEATIQVFREIAISLPSKKHSTERLRVLFDESNTSLYGVNDDGPSGSSGIRDYLVDKGHDVRSHSSFRLGPIMTYRPDLLVLRGVNSAIGKDKVDKYIELVKEGLIMIVFVDQSDAKHKECLLEEFEQPLSEFTTLENISSYNVYGESNLVAGSDNSGVYMIGLKKPVVLDNPNKASHLFTMNITDTENDVTDRRALCFEYAVKKGAVIFVGDIHAWSNNQINLHDSVDFLDELLFFCENKVDKYRMNTMITNSMNKSI